MNINSGTSRDSFISLETPVKPAADTKTPSVQFSFIISYRMKQFTIVLVLTLAVISTIYGKFIHSPIFFNREIHVSFE